MSMKKQGKKMRKMFREICRKNNVPKQKITMELFRRYVSDLKGNGMYQEFCDKSRERF